MTPKSFVVVGAGLGGLATALRLTHLGHRVTVLEKTDQIGGRNRERRVGESVFDAGPTLLMMLDPLRRLFHDVGEKLEDHLDISPCEPGYRAFYRDGTRLHCSTDVATMVRQIEDLSGKKDARAYPRMLKELGELYEASIPNFVRKNFYGPLDFFGGRALSLVVKHRMLGNMARGVERYMDDPRLRMLFSFQSMYLGLSPFRAPWVYAVLTYMEYGEGITYPRGGLVEICRAVARLGAERGVKVLLNSPVRRILPGAVELESGERLEADAIVCNADLPYAERALLAPPKNSLSSRTPTLPSEGEGWRTRPNIRRRRRRLSCSAYMLYIDYAGQLPELLHHNVFFGADFRANLEDIFTRLRLPDDPAFYACVSARSDAPKAKAGHENLMVLVPCPNLDRPWSDADGERLRQAVFSRLTQDVGFDPTRVAALESFSPLDWAEDLNLEGGAAFGLSHDFWQSAYFRAGNRSRTHPGVYFVGASTVPGNGLPMVLISAELVEDRLRHDGYL